VPHPRSSVPFLLPAKQILAPSFLPPAIRPPPCLPASPDLAPPLQHPAPPAAIGGLPVGDPRATPRRVARPAPLSTRRGCSRFAPPGDPLVRRGPVAPPLAVRRGPTPAGYLLLNFLRLYPRRRLSGEAGLLFSPSRWPAEPLRRRPPCHAPRSCSLMASVPATVQRGTSRLLHRRDPAKAPQVSSASRRHRPSPFPTKAPVAAPLHYAK